ncbi:putative ATP-dependent RNA helicase DHR1 [Lambiella insularis]|nr:putative ATP-dependent RNA helicase DHR1 [Lambiella insularis]
MAPFVPRQRKHKGRQTQHHAQTGGHCRDSNVREIIPSISARATTKNHDTQSHSEKMIDGQLAMSSQRRKRLDKYLDKKLRKDENLELIKKLSSSKGDTSSLKSSKTLGQGNFVNVADSRATKSPTAKDQDFDDDSDDGEGQSSTEVAEHSSKDPRSSPPSKREIASERNTVGAASAPGAGLKRPLDLDHDGKPMLKRRRRDVAQLSAQSRVRRNGITQTERLRDSPSSDPDSDSSPLGSRPGSSASKNETQVCDPGDSADGSRDDLTSSESSDETESDQDELNTDSEASQSAPSDKDLEDKPRSETFKKWASDISVAENGISSATSVEKAVHLSSPIRKTSVAIAAKQHSVPKLSSNNIFDYARKLFSVNVVRTAEAALARLKLPVVAEEQRIMEAIHNHPIVVICGSTGSGKTTQVPQFLYEAGYGSSLSPTPGMIGITQPRRVAAVSSAIRVAEELNSPNVAYQIRFDSTVGPRTAIKYMTDGILLREIAEDFALSKYSAIIIDEAHERTTNTDLLIGMLTRIVELRVHFARLSPLKLIIMSATLRLTDFILNPKLFRYGQPPVVEIEGRQYPVTVHFARRTEGDYMEEAYGKVCKAHKKLPPGGMLIFLTGQDEILTLASRLNEALSGHTNAPRWSSAKVSANEVPLDIEDLEVGDENGREAGPVVGDEDEGSVESDSEFAIEENSKATTNVLILPLYSQLPIEEQRKVFSTKLPLNTRLIVVATNVAETSLTIPGIRYVFDCGRAKERKYDRNTGVQSFEIGWISKASANQRAGRAGRTGPGHCYRLYSSAVYERDFEDHAEPEILRSPIESIVLQLKSMGIQDILNFPFPTPPDMNSLMQAERLLRNMSAVTAAGEVTALGRELATYPLSPRFAKMLTLGHQGECIYITIATVAALAIGNLFVPDSQLSASGVARRGQNPRLLFNRTDQSTDVCSLLSALAAYSWAVGWRDGKSWCAKMGLRPKALKEAYQLWRQLVRVVSMNRPGLLDPKILLVPQLDKRQMSALKQIVAAGFIDHIAIRADLAPNPPATNGPSKHAIHIPYFTLFPSYSGKAKTLDEKAVFIHPSSLLAELPSSQLPKFTVYSHLQRSSPSLAETTRVPKTRMHPLTAVSGKQILALARGSSSLLEYGKPIGKIEPVVGKSGLRDSRICWLAVNLVGENGSTGWPLPAQKVQQRFNKSGRWEIEKFLE